MSVQVKYATNARFELIEIEAHIDNNVEVNYFDKNAEHDEFVCVSHYDREKKESVKLFLTKEALEKFVERMAAVCALRFKNKG